MRSGGQAVANKHLARRKSERDAKEIVHLKWLLKPLAGMVIGGEDAANHQAAARKYDA